MQGSSLETSYCSPMNGYSTECSDSAGSGEHLPVHSVLDEWFDHCRRNHAQGEHATIAAVRRWTLSLGRSTSKMRGGYWLS